MSQTRGDGGSCPEARVAAEPDPDEVGVLYGGLWVPRTERHLQEVITEGKGHARVDGKLTYQYRKQEAAWSICDRFREDWREGTFVDVGAHIGTWGMWWVPKMAHTVAFEPVPQFRALYRRNVTCQRYDLRPVALGAEPGTIRLAIYPDNSGKTHATDDPEGLEVPVSTLDHELLDDLPDPTVLKVDCEGFEENVLRGGEVLIRRNRPVIIVEQKRPRVPGVEWHGGLKFLEGLGYRSVREMSGDHIMVHPGT